MDGNSSDMSESSCDKTKQTSASKKRPVSDPSSNESKRKKKMQQFQWPFAKLRPALACLQGDNLAFCKLCRTDISISHGGANDIMRHCKPERHRQIQQGRKNIHTSNLQRLHS